MTYQLDAREKKEVARIFEEMTGFPVMKFLDGDIYLNQELVATKEGIIE